MEEGRIFVHFFLFGMIAFAAYDGIRVVRRIFPHGIFMISLEDLVYWMVISLCFFLHLCQVNNGKIRGYVLLGSLLGCLLYTSPSPRDGLLSRMPSSA